MLQWNKNYHNQTHKTIEKWWNERSENKMQDRGAKMEVNKANNSFLNLL